MATKEARAVGALESSLSNSGFAVERTNIDGHEVVLGRRSDFRWRWYATRLHMFVVVFVASDLSSSLAEELTGRAQQYAIRHKGGLPRGFATGTATIPVFLTDRVDSVVREWFTTQPKGRFAALCFPVLGDTRAGTVIYFKGRMALGYAYRDHLLGVITDVIEPAVAADSTLPRES